MTQQEQPGQEKAALVQLDGETRFEARAQRRELAEPQPHPELEQLIAVLEQLRAPGGCAWDAEQTHESLVRYLIEETYELIDAIESGNRDELIEELGDVLYQVIFHSDIAAHTPGEEFTLEDVAAHMTAKMVGRHPHVYGELADELAASETTDTAADVNVRWDEIKKIEKPTRTSVLDGVPQGMPALALADKLLGKAEKLGMPAPLLSEAAAAGSGAGVGAGPGAQTEPELGDQLLAIVASARAKGLDSERALRAALRTLQDEMRIAENH
jgi:XTP/dITP diphosphohydrolase